MTPDVTVHRPDKGESGPSIGAIVTMIAKGEGSTAKRKEQAKIAAVLVWMFAQAHLVKSGTPDRSICFSYDVFDGQLIPAGANISMRIKNIEAACEEIAHAWANATPPDDLDD